MKKLFIVCLLLLTLTACEFLTGKKITTTDAYGNKVVTYEDAPIDQWTGILSLLVPALGGTAVVLGRMAKNAARTRDAFLETNEEAIKEMDLKGMVTAENAKLALNTAQSMHHDSKLLQKEYKKFKAKKAKKG